jgi:hypothetical protein
MMKHPDIRDPLFGHIAGTFFNGTVCVVRLFNHGSYEDSTLLGDPNVPPDFRKRGLIILLPAYQWDYISEDRIPKPPLELPLEELRDQLRKDSDDKMLTAGVPETPLEKELFGEPYVDIELSTRGEKVELSQTDRDFLSGVLRNSNAMQLNKEGKMEVAVNASIAIKNEITTLQDEQNEGEKIVKWIGSRLVTADSPFKDLTMIIRDGYVHIARQGIPAIDTVQPGDGVELKHYPWQAGKPINYDVFKYILFQNAYQKGSKTGQSERDEAERILGLEYVLALQPKPLYQLYCLKRMILAWYTDPELEANVRKIKVLINQWRAGPNPRGILPSIIVYPKYGRESYLVVLSKIEYWFSGLNWMAWDGSKPKYFVEESKLVYKANGSSDLKSWYEGSLKQSMGSNTNDVFDPMWSTFRSNSLERMQMALRGGGGGPK